VPFPRNREVKNGQFLNDWTVSWYFQHLYQEVLYRPTPEGPDVVAVGSDEIHALTNGRKIEKVAGLKTYQD
jgi:hypothetical protein